MKKIVLLSSLFFVAVTVAYLGAKSVGAHPGSTGAPGEKTCADASNGCHADASIADGNTVNTLTVNDNTKPEFYQNDSVYTLSIKVQEPSGLRFGFEIVALDDNNNNIGKFLPPVINNKRTHIISNAGRSYVTHELIGTEPTKPGENEWTFGWQAPHSSSSGLHFYYMTNVCNGNGANTGDKLYKSSLHIPNKLNINDVADNGNGITPALKVFPNPTTDILSVTFPIQNTFDVPTCSIVDIQGNVIAHLSVISFIGNTLLLSIPTNVPNGTYILHVSNNVSTYRQKLVVAR